MTATKPTRADILKEAGALARAGGLYIIPREEKLHGQTVVMFYLFRRLRFGHQGSSLGKRRTPEGLLKLIKQTLKNWRP